MFFNIRLLCSPLFYFPKPHMCGRTGVDGFCPFVPFVCSTVAVVFVCRPVFLYFLCVLFRLCCPCSLCAWNIYIYIYLHSETLISPHKNQGAKRRFSSHFWVKAQRYKFFNVFFLLNFGVFSEAALQCVVPAWLLEEPHCTAQGHFQIFVIFIQMFWQQRRWSKIHLQVFRCFYFSQERKIRLKKPSFAQRNTEVAFHFFWKK